MVLVTLSGGAFVYAGGDYMQACSLMISVSKERNNRWGAGWKLTGICSRAAAGLVKKLFTSDTMGVSGRTGNQLDIYSKDKNHSLQIFIFWPFLRVIIKEWRVKVFSLKMMK